MKTCQITIEGFDFKAYYHKCGRAAKFLSPPDSFTKKQHYVCGIHRRSIDRMYKKLKSQKRCKPINAEREP